MYLEFVCDRADVCEYRMIHAKASLAARGFDFFISIFSLLIFCFTL